MFMDLNWLELAKLVGMAALIIAIVGLTESDWKGKVLGWTLLGFFAYRVISGLLAG